MEANLWRMTDANKERHEESVCAVCNYKKPLLSKGLFIQELNTVFGILTKQLILHK